jgi:hypothetical protein
MKANNMPSLRIAWLLAVTCLVVFLGAQDASAQGGTIMKNGLTSIHFERSGGLFALGKPLAADVVFGPSSAVVRTEDGTSRTLTDAEIAMFQRIDPARLREFAQSRQAGGASPGLPDDYQFDLAFSFTDGSIVRLTFHQHSLPDLKLSPVLAELANWVIAEVERIWSAR